MNKQMNIETNRRARKHHSIQYHTCVQEFISRLTEKGYCDTNLLCTTLVSIVYNNKLRMNACDAIMYDEYYLSKCINSLVRDCYQNNRSIKDVDIIFNEFIRTVFPEIKKHDIINKLLMKRDFIESCLPILLLIHMGNKSDLFHVCKQYTRQLLGNPFADTEPIQINFISFQHYVEDISTQLNIISRVYK